MHRELGDTNLYQNVRQKGPRAQQPRIKVLGLSEQVVMVLVRPF